MAGVIQGLELNLSLLILFDAACSSNIEFILSENDSIDRFNPVGLIGEHRTNLYQNSQAESLFDKILTNLFHKYWNFGMNYLKVH